MTGLGQPGELAQRRRRGQKCAGARDGRPERRHQQAGRRSGQRRRCQRRRSQRRNNFVAGREEDIDFGASGLAIWVQATGHHSAQRADYNPRFIGKKLIIRTVDALAGAGKTFAAGKHAARAAGLGQKTLMVQPTKDLITETLGGIRQHSPDIRLTAIHSDTTEHVVADIVQH